MDSWNSDVTKNLNLLYLFFYLLISTYLYKTSIKVIKSYGRLLINQSINKAMAYGIAPQHPPTQNTTLKSTPWAEGIEIIYRSFQLMDQHFMGNQDFIFLNFYQAFCLQFFSVPTKFLTKFYWPNLILTISFGSNLVWPKFVHQQFCLD